MNDVWSRSRLDTVATLEEGPERDEPETACALCAADVRSGHRHLLPREVRSVVCEACWDSGAEDAGFRPTSVRVKWLDDVRVPERVWSEREIGPALDDFFYGLRCRGTCR